MIPGERPAGKPLRNGLGRDPVVTSGFGNILMSAAHILSGRNAAELLFIPGYARGKAPHGVWSIHESYVTAAWHKEQNIEDDFCFLKLNADIQRSVGSLMLFDCGGYPNGTSGSPWIVKNSAYGLIGGYQQGGDSPSTSYSPYFGENVRSLYETATAAT